MPSTRAPAAALFAVVVVAWGLNYLFVREGLTVIDPLWLAFLRAFVGSLGVAAYYALRPGGTPLDRAGVRDALLLGIPNTGLFFGLWFLAAGAIAPGVTSVIVYTFPLWVALLTVGLDRRGLPPAVGAALTVGFVGVVLVAQPWRSGSGGLPIVPVVELLAGSVCWALGTVLLQRRFPPDQLPRANGWQLAGGSAVLLAGASLLEPTGAAFPVTLPIVATVAWLGLLGSSVAYGIWFYLLGTYDAPRLSALTFLVPVVALVASVLLLGESLTGIQVAGVALVLVAIYVVASGRRSTPPPPVPIPGVPASGSAAADPSR